MTELTFKEKTTTPVELLLDPETGRAAAYNDNHRLVVEEASDALRTYMENNAHTGERWKESDWKPNDTWRPMPAWATAEVRARCVLLRLNVDWENDEQLRQIPRR